MQVHLTLFLIKEKSKWSMKTWTNGAEQREKTEKISLKAVKEKKLKREWIRLDRLPIINSHARFLESFVEKNQKRIGSVLHKTFYINVMQ